MFTFLFVTSISLLSGLEQVGTHRYTPFQWSLWFLSEYWISEEIPILFRIYTLFSKSWQFWTFRMNYVNMGDAPNLACMLTNTGLSHHSIKAKDPKLVTALWEDRKRKPKREGLYRGVSLSKLSLPESLQKKLANNGMLIWEVSPHLDTSALNTRKPLNSLYSAVSLTRCTSNQQQRKNANLWKDREVSWSLWKWC